jgi:hypothetical protein
MVMKVLYHLGLGDAIATAAIIGKLSRQYENVEIPCWEHNLRTVQTIFHKLPNVVIKSFNTEREALDWGEDADMKLGHYNKWIPKLNDEDFIQWFYRQAHFDISEKDKYCPILDASKNIFNNYGLLIKDYSVIHQDLERGFEIKVDNVNFQPFCISKKYSGTYGEVSILNYAKIIENAKEIHCIDSSVLHLVECLPTKAKLFYHKYARPNSTDYKYLTKNWEVIE